MQCCFSRDRRNVPSRSGRRGAVLVQWLLSATLVAAGLLWQFWPAPSRPIEVPCNAGVGGAAAERSQSPLTMRPIDEMRVGDRVHAENPAGVEDDSLGELTPSTWCRLELRAPKVDGSWADVVLLRPKTWLQQQQAAEGGRVRISVPECGIDGRAEVLRIGPCPPIKRGSGRVVTGTFRHAAANVLDLRIEGLDSPIGTTANHPFWSNTRQAFVRADSLTSGEQLASLDVPRDVLGIIRRPAPESVFNIEVHGRHVYHVSSHGILVHNGNLGICPKGLRDMWVKAKSLATFKQTKTLASTPDNVLFVSGGGYFRSKKAEAALADSLRNDLGPLWSASSKPRVEGILEWLKGMDIKVQKHAHDFPLEDGAKAVAGSYNASHAEVQALYHFFSKYKTAKDWAPFLEDGRIVISISHDSGACSSCRGLLTQVAQKTGSRFQVRWTDDLGQMYWWRNFP